MTVREVGKHFIAACVTLFVVIPFVWPTRHIVEEPLAESLWVLVGLSAVANLMVLTYHHVVPAHPKFMIIPWRRAILLVHIVSGTTEFLAGLVALLGGGVALAGEVMALVALVFHVPSALAQTPSVFGSRAIMRPSYLMCIALHAWCAAMLWMNPASVYWTVATFLLFNTYVWVRVYFYALDKFGFFEGSKYTVAVVLAGVTTTPVVLGPTAMMVIALGWVVFIAAHTALFIRSRAAFLDFVRERARDSAYSEGVRAMWDRGEAQAIDVATEFFKLLDRDDDGFIEPDELEEVLARSQVPTRAVRHYMESRAEGGRLPLAAFLAHLWPITEVRRVAREVVFTRGEDRSDVDKAQFVFRRLDLDGDGLIGRRELEDLLSEWSLPGDEVNRWATRLGLGPDEGISFGVFFEKMRPIWRFIYYDVIEARYGSGDDLIERVFAAWRDDSETRGIAQDLREQLLRRVGFLSGADEAFVRALAVCLVEERLAAGEVMFSEGDPGEEFFLIRSGQVRVQRAGETLAVLGEGDWLGEGALMSTRARSATAEVVQDAVLFRASSAAFHYLVERHPQMKEVLERLNEERRVDIAMLRVRVRLLRGVPWLVGAPDDVLEALAARLERGVAQGVVFGEGEPTTAFYIIGAGSVTLFRDGGTIVELPGTASFGEEALYGGATRTSTAVAAPGTVLYSLTPADVAWLAAAWPPVEAALASRRAGGRAGRRVSG